MIDVDGDVFAFDDDLCMEPGVAIGHRVYFMLIFAGISFAQLVPGIVRLKYVLDGTMPANRIGIHKIEGTKVDRLIVTVILNIEGDSNEATLQHISSFY